MIAAIVGFIMGFLGSVPVAGPIAILVVSRGVAGRPRHGIAIAAGGAIPEAIYCGLAFLGMGTLFTTYPSIGLAARALAGVILLVLGFYFIRTKPEHINPSERVRSFEPDGLTKDFLLGFTITILNPTLLLTWTAAIAAVSGFRIFTFSVADHLLFPSFAFLGIVVWFFLLLEIIKHSTGRFSNRTLALILKSMGVLLWVFAALFLSAFLKDILLYL